MSKIKIGILKEGKIPIDRRAPIVPKHAHLLQENFPGLEILCQTSPIRCYTDEEYANEQIEIVNDLSGCDILVGVKEVPVSELIPEKTYMFFSHTIKKQPYNRELLKAVIAKNITLIDYECLVNNENQRIVAFGRYAGLVGGYNAILTFGKKYNLFDLRPAYQCFDLEDLKNEFPKIKIPPVRIVITGGGRVAKGAMEVLMGMKLRRVTAHKFVTERLNFPVFTQLNARDYNKRIDGGPFKRADFYKNPTRYESNFLQYASEAEILIAGAFWDPQAPVLFTREDIMSDNFNIKVVADITCDIEGSIPSTKKASSIEDPNYDYNPSEDRVEAPFSDEGNITVMAVDNLPCELPRDSSHDFSTRLTEQVFPYLIGDDSHHIIDRATIAANGKLTKRFEYLTDYLEG